MLKRIVLILGMLCLVATARADQSAPIKIGVLTSITGLANQAHAFDNGAQMAVDDINAHSGVLGKNLELVLRDDKNSPSAAVMEAQRLVEQDKVPVLMGTFLDNLSLAVSSYAKRAKVPFLKPTGGTDKFIGQDGNRYAFMNDVSTDTLGHMLAIEAAKNPAKRWTALIPDYEYGHAMYASFRKYMSALRPDVVWVDEEYIPCNKIDTGAIVNIIQRANPDAILAVIFGNDLIKFYRAANERGLFKDTLFVSPYLGYPEYLGTFGAEAPIGWLTQGFPSASFTDPKLKDFVKRYEAKFGESPGGGSLDGYVCVQFIAAAITKAKSTDREAITDALKGIEIDAPQGKLRMRAQDNHSNYGAWIGKTALINGKPTLSDWHYENAGKYLPNNDAKAKP
ncbi:MAG: ABC transporter substrate-binding protein [Alphaproteobacteria bacterium]|nr:ABC transporter substrate-binding protein [Alphaproteobacteria bacterium]